MSVASRMTAGFFCAVFTSALVADVTPIGSFNADAYDSFDNYPNGFIRNPVRAFEDNAQVMSNTSSGWIHTTGSWSYRTRVRALDGPRLLGSTRNGLAFEFDRGISAFGAYFATNSGVAGGRISFFDSQGILLGSESINITDDGLWSYNAWGTDHHSISRIEITGNKYGPGVGGFVMMDDASIRFSSVPAPGVLAGLGLLLIARTRRRG